MQQHFLMGVDLGTSLAKAGVYDTHGNLLGEAREATAVRYPRPGLAEQDPGEFYRSTMATVRGALERARIDPARVAALSIDSQAGGIMAIDERWEPVTHFDSPLDTRSATQKLRMVSEAGDRMVTLAGAQPTYGQKILWWKETQPEVWKRVHKFIQPAAYVAGRMAGLKGEQAFMEPAFMCWSGLSDSANRCWSEELCARFDVPLDVLPRVVPAHEIVGYLSAEAGRNSGLPAGLPIVAGTADAAASLLGAGVVDPGTLFDVAGTACIFGVCLDHFCADTATRTLSCMSSALPGRFYQLAIVLGGRTHDWFVREFCPEEASVAARRGVTVYDIMDAKAAALAPGSEGVLCVPQLGGRWNPAEPNVRGLWIGFGWGHRREHLYRSILESVAYEYALYLARVHELSPHADFPEVRVTSGGARSRLWNQIKCDVLGIPYLQLAREDHATWGSALIAGHAVGIFPDLAASAKECARAGDRQEPDKAANQAYRAYAALYPRLFESNAATFSTLAHLGTQSAGTARGKHCPTSGGTRPSSVLLERRYTEQEVRRQAAMASAIKLPDLGTTVEECKVLSWRVKEGEAVKRGQILADIETDKAVAELESTAAGVVLQLVAKAGAVVRTGDVLAYVGRPGEVLPAAAQPGAARDVASGTAQTSATPATSPVTATSTQSSEKPAAELSVAAPAATPGSVRVSPLVRNLAAKLGVDLSRVQGTGPGGVITREDVQRARSSPGGPD